MIYYLYKIINKTNDHYYYGRRACTVHPSKDPYMGSGIRIKAAIKKYGINNFEKQIIDIFNTEVELIAAETALITESILSDPTCYNLAKGGKGGYTYYADRIFKHTENSKRKISDANKGRKRPDSSETLYRLGINKWWLGKKRSEADKSAKREAAEKALKEGNHPSKMLATCPHCSYTTSIGNIKRWHLDNCRRK